jgi:hypothetical protein
MHLANTPVVSPESKTPHWRGFVMFKLSLLIAASGAALPSMNELSKLLGENQVIFPK